VPTNYYRVENREHDADNLEGAGPSGAAIHRKLIEPWLSAIFQSEHLNLLLGAGFSMGLAQTAGVQATSMANVAIDAEFDALINAAAGRSAIAMGRGATNIEDQFRAAIALNEGLSIQADVRHETFSNNLNQALAEFANSLVQMESAILAQEAIGSNYEKFERLLTGFLLSFASRTASRDRLHIFTTNYDRMIEHGFDLLGIRPIDRFVGALTQRFRASRFDIDIHYSPAGVRSEARPLEGVVRLTKLHGSIDWAEEEGHIIRRAMPLGGPQSFTPTDAAKLMIFPNAAKDIETAFFPYAELFRDFSAAICRPNSALITYGYGFGDDHVNRIIRDMLTLPSTHLVIISYDEASGRIKRFLDRSGRHAQSSLIIGPQLAALEELVENYLPKPAIDTITQRQSELLERRGSRERNAGDLI
jgi:hypothetical protein